MKGVVSRSGQPMKLTEKSIFGPYKLIQRLGAGGMGTVWSAIDTRLERTVALKFLNSDDDDPKNLARFQRESRIVSRLNHPNLLTVFEAGIIDDVPYISSELVDGTDLSDVIRAKKTLPESEVKSIGVQVLKGLQAAHSVGVIHRDIKPANIRLRPDGVVKLLDFGVARVSDETAITAANGVLGSPRYLAPERFGGSQTDYRSDLFSVGAMLYFLLTGHPAVRGNSIPEVIQNLLHKRIELLEPTSLLRKVINRSLKKRPDARYQSALEMLEALDQAQVSYHHEDDEDTEDLALEAWRPSVIFCPVSVAKEEDRPLADGIHLEANTRLGSHKSVRLIAPFSYQNQGTVSLDLATELEADYVFTSKIRRSGETVRFNLSLVSMDSAEQIWSEHLDLKSNNDFEIEDRCVEWLDSCVEEQFEPKNTTVQQRSWFGDLKIILKKCLTGDRNCLAEATDSLSALTDRHPDQPELHGHLANFLLLRGQRSQQEYDKFRAPAMQHAMRCLELDPDCHLGYLAQARSLIGPTNADWAGAEKMWRVAFSKAPTSVDVNVWRASFDVLRGCTARGMLRAEKVLENEPDAPGCLSILALAHLSKGCPQHASEIANRILRSRADDTLGLAVVFVSDLMLGQMEEAARFSRFLDRQLQRARSEGIRDFLLEPLLFVAQAVQDPDAARARTTEAEPFFLSSRISARIALDGYGILGDHESGKACMNRLIETGFANIPYLESDSLLKPFQGEEWWAQGLEALRTNAR